MEDNIDVVLKNLLVQYGRDMSVAEPIIKTYDIINLVLMIIGISS